MDLFSRELEEDRFLIDYLANHCDSLFGSSIGDLKFKR